MPTIEDVAKRAGVSVATVSAVINSDSDVNVSQELSKKVKKAVQELNYRPNRIARALSKNETKIIAYVVPSIRNNFFSQVGHHIENRAFENEFGVYLCNTHCKLDRIQLYKNNLIDNRVGGVVTTLTWGIIESNFIEELLEAGIPVVGLAGARETEIIDTVTINDIKGSKRAVEYLIKKGYKNIGFIGVKNSKTTELREKGYRLALKEKGINYAEELIEYGKDFSRKQGYNLVTQMINNHSISEIDAIFVYNDVMASGVIDKLNSLSVEVPEDIAVVGFDDSVAKYTRPKLTTMSLPKKEMVNIAIGYLFDRMEEKNIKIRKKQVTPKLIKRDSA